MTIRLLVTDDHELVRAGLVNYLGMTPGIEVVAEAASGTELLEKLRSTSADLLLLDMTMPGISGEELIGRIKESYPDLPILVLSMHNEIPFVMRVMSAGASGYISKERPPQVLLEAIRQTIKTGKYLHPAMAEQMEYADASADPDGS
ncbi:MAG: hypothetical protein A3H99_04645 [Gallionellales bacterium RIFCSPLOWO2_02_FULL_59_110]|nr:MAG: hypothetical protein A3H99_04645 [Gallionellales bacterium RIFCSPLOWO2_02_FULL_59_110]